MKTEDTEVLGRQRAKPSKIKARYNRKCGKYAQFELPGNFTKLTYNDSITD